MTGRPVREWVGKTLQAQIPARVKARIVVAQDGLCGCGCGVELGASGESIEFDHHKALVLGGENRESNIHALRSRCHKSKTRRDVAQKSTEARKRNNHFGFRKSNNHLPGSKGSRFKRKVNGIVILRDER